jgi:hypothetical protein
VKGFTKIDNFAHNFTRHPLAPIESFCGKEKLKRGFLSWLYAGVLNGAVAIVADYNPLG